MITLYGVVIGVAILCLWWGLTARPPAARANLFADLPEPEAPESKLVGLTRGLGHGASRVIPKPLTDGLRSNLVQAGYPGGMDMARLVGMKVMLAILFGGFLTVLGHPLWGIAFALLGFFGPDSWILSERDKRSQRVEEKAAKLGVKMIFPIVFCFMLVLFIIILVPAVSGLAEAFG